LTHDLEGGGIIGCTTAYYLTRHPSYDPERHKITLIEATRIAGGASGKAGGLLALWAYPSNIVPLSYELHKQLSDEHNGEETWGYRVVSCGNLEANGRGRKEMIGPTSAPQQSGMSLGKRKGLVGQGKAVSVPKSLDWILPNLITNYEAMAEDNTTAQVHPYFFTTSMLRLAQERGVDVIIGKVDALNYTELKMSSSSPMPNDDVPPFSPPSPAPSSESISSNGSNRRAVQSVKYKDEAGNTHTIGATTIILTAGPWTANLYPSAPISGLRAHSVTITPAAPVSGYALFTEITIPPLEDETTSPGSPGDGTRQRRRKELPKTAAPEIYSRPNNEIYVCGEGDMEVELPATTADVEVDEERCDELLAQVSSISDHIRLGRVTRKQACYLPIVSVGASGGPLIGFTDTEGLILATGHSCWGINNAPATGLLVSEMVFDGEAKSADIQMLDPRRIL
jgi:glycine/D-amino acid oxidase-like deaminating enzyme